MNRNFILYRRLGRFSTTPMIVTRDRTGPSLPSCRSIVITFRSRDQVADKARERAYDKGSSNRLIHAGKLPSPILGPLQSFLPSVDETLSLGRLHSRSQPPALLPLLGDGELISPKSHSQPGEVSSTQCGRF